MFVGSSRVATLLPRVQLRGVHRQALRLSVDPRVSATFTDLKIVRRITEHLPNVSIRSPTEAQKKVLTVLNSRYSLLARNDHGSGNSVALLLHALNLRVNLDKNGTSITPSALLLLNTTNAVVQAENLVRKIFQNVPLGDTVSAQFLYRSSNEDIESAQLENLTSTNAKETTHLIVGTAPRLLDIISQKPDLLPPLNELKFIGVDDADDQFLTANALANVVKRKQKPAEILVDYLIQENASPHNLQLAFVNSTDTSSNLQKLINAKEWCRDEAVKKTKQKQLVVIGNAEVDTLVAIPPRQIPNNVRIHAVNAHSAGESYIMKNAKVPDIPVGDDALAELSSEEALSFDLQFRKYRVTRSNKVFSGNALLTSYSKALKQFLSHSVQEKYPLLVIPDNVSLVKAQKALQAQGVDAKILVAQEQTDQDSTHCSYSRYKAKDPSDGGPQVLITSVHGVKGLALPNLLTIIGLGIDTIKDAAGLVTLATRLRSTSGLIENAVTQAPKDQSSLIETLSRHLILFSLKSDFGTREALALYRAVLKSGLSGLDPLEPLETESIKDYPPGSN